MRRFVSRSELHVPVKINGMWRTLHFSEMPFGYAYICTDDDEYSELKSHPFMESGEMWLEETQDEQPRRVAETEEGQRYMDTKAAKEEKKEIVEGISTCSDARAYLRERFSDESVLLRSKKEITDYASSKNIYFSDL